MSTATLKQLTILIDRDASTTLPATVFEYEMPLLEQIYNEEQLSEHESKSVKVEDFDVEKAYDGLKTKYRSPEGIAALKTIYPNLTTFKKAVPAAKASKAAAADEGEEKEGEAPTHKTIPQITAELPDMSDEELDELEAEENEREKPRSGVLSAIESERAKREQ